MEYTAINLKNKLEQVSDLWSPRVVAALNDYRFKVARVHGEFVWHSHEDTDEAFIVLAGELSIRFRDGEVHLGVGEMYVVPRGVEHCPVARKECHVLLVEPSGLVNTGDAGGEMTAPLDEWI